MEILIVDDEASTREALRDVLTQMGHKPILEAKNGDEALKFLEAEKTKIRMIIADWEMPQMDGITLADRLAERGHLDSIPFLLITSDLPAKRLEELKQHHPRIDHSLLKPFRSKVIEEAIRIAYANRISRRDAVLWVGSEPPSPALLAAVSGKNRGFFFNRVVTDPTSRDFSAVVLDLNHAGLDASAVTALRKTPFGAQAVWIGMSRDPVRIGPFRMICNLFVDPGPLQSEDGWVKQLSTLHERLKNGWEIEFLSLEAKGLIHQKKNDLARKSLEKLLVLDPVNAESHAWIADLLILEGDESQAVFHEFESLKINPCLPKPYIKLFEILSRTDPAQVKALADAARGFCPHSPDVLNAAASALEVSVRNPSGQKK